MADEKLHEEIGHLKGMMEFIVKYFEKNGLVEQVRENKTSIFWLRLFVIAILMVIVTVALK